MSQSRLAAVRLTRKAVSIAIFNQTHLEYAHVRHLPTATAKACETLQSFLTWMSAQFELELIAVEQAERPDQRRIQELILTLEEHASEAAVPVWRASKLQVIGSYAEPAPGTRIELREIAARIWPMLSSKDNHPLDLESAALGLYVQVERLLSTPSQ
jgi:hypothetical protein